MTNSEPEKAAAFLAGGGEMGHLIRSMDWSETTLGPVESWPQSLRTTVSLCLASNFPINIIWGPNHNQIYNDGYWPICGGKHPRSMGQDFSECWESAWPAIGEAFGRAIAGHASFLENQRMFLDRNGYLEETFFTFSFSPIRDESSGVGGLFHPVTETTGKMLSERRTRTLRDLAARTSKARSVEEALALTAQTLGDYDLDLPFVVLYAIDANSQQARLAAGTGLTAGSPASPEFVDPNATGGSAWPLGEAVRTGAPVLLDDVKERVGPPPYGPYPEPPKAALLLPLTPAGAGGPVAVLVAGVSPRLPLNEAYRDFYDLLASGVTAALANARAYEDERRRAEALAELDRAKTAFFANVSHEFRTPLTLILGPLEDALAETKDRRQRDRLELLHRNALRLQKLVNTLLDFSRIEAGRIEASYEPTDLATLTEELASVFRSVVEKAGIRLVVHSTPLSEPVYVDRDMWEKVVLNLLSNAFKFTLEGEIEVGLRARDAAVDLFVRDTGTGIAKEQLPHIFERFHRVEGARARTHEGTGIGLAMVHELVKLHGGVVTVQSVEGRGSTFTVAIPRGKGHLPADRIGVARRLSSTALAGSHYLEEALRWLPDDTAASPPFDSALVAEVRRGAAADGPRSRIVWADDNADMRDYVGRLLRSHYEVEAVANGEAALAAVQRQPPDLVLADVMMPRLDGFGLLRELRGDERTRNTPVILLSARAGEEAQVEGMQAGADDYLTKPFSARELLARVEAHVKMGDLRRQATAALRESEKQFRALVAASSDVVYRMSPDWNEMRNLQGSEFITDTLEPSRIWLDKYIHPDDQPMVTETIHRAIAAKTTFELEHRVVRVNGTLGWTFSRAIPVPNERGEIVEWFGAATDITERKRAEERQAFLLKLSDALRPLGDPLEIQRQAMRVLGEDLGVLRAQYWEADSTGDYLDSVGGYTNGQVQPVTERIRMDDFGTYVKESLHAGRVTAVADVSADPGVSEAELAAYDALGFRACAAVPLVKHGRLVGLLGLHHATPRQWTDEELVLVVETAERTWAAVERAKTEAALAASEEKYRTLFDSIDEGVATIEVIFDEQNHAVDFVFLENNAALTRLTGLPDGVIGKRAAEVVPNVEYFWLETYGRIAKTGKPERFEHASGDLNGNWFDVYASRVGGIGSHQVVAVYKNITERKRREANLAFLAELSEDLVQLTNINAMMNALGAKIGRHFNASLCTFAEIDEAADKLNVGHGWNRPDVPSILGVWRVSDYVTGDMRQAARAGETITVRDVRSDRRVDAESTSRLGIGSFISVPLLRDGQLRFALSIYDCLPRDWGDDEIELMRELAARIWARLERARAEEALRDSERRLRRMVNMPRVGVLTFDFCGRLVGANDAFLEMVGYSRDQFQARTLTWQDFTPPEYLQESERQFENLRQKGAAGPYEKEYFRRDGSKIWLMFVASDLGDGTIVEYAVDISDRKRAEEAFRASEAVFRTLGESLPDLLWMSDAVGRPIYQNPAWRAYTGLTHEGLARDGWQSMHHPEDLPRLQGVWDEALRSGNAFTLEYRCRRHDGEYRWFLARTVPVRDQAGSVIKWIGTSTDIHDHKRLEASLKDADRRKDEFLATLAHELRNPLAPIRNSLHILRLAGSDSGAAERVQEMMERQVNHMVRLVDDLMEVSRITRGTIELKQEQIELAAIFRSGVETSKPLIEAAGHQLAISLPAEPLILEADPVRLAQVLANLLNNAAKYTDDGGKIWLTARREGTDSVISVRDSGTGIPSDMLARIFDPFIQVNRTYHRAQGGLGIGLALVKSLVEMHGGSIEAKSDGPGQGSEFVVRLPLAEGRPRIHGRGLRDDQPVTLVPRRILVVDDNRDAADSLGILLKFLGTDVYTANEGPAALEALRIYRPSVVLMDIGMPGMDGFEVARRARQQPEGKDVTLIALTGWGQEEDRRRSKEAGFDHHLVKPVDLGALQVLLASLPHGRS